MKIPSAPINPEPPAGRKRVLFVCIGNSCRSPMAEAFARAYGSDVIEAHSAGLSPAAGVQPLTFQVMREKNVSMDGVFPKGLDALTWRQPLDVLVNMSGHRVALPASQVVSWVVRDPVGEDEAVYRAVANQIEGLVMHLILRLRGN